MRWRIYPIRELPALRAEWNALNASTGNLPFLQSEFLIPALREFGAGTELLVSCEADGANCAMGVLRQRYVGVWETFQPSQLPLGAFLMRDSAPVDRMLDALLRALPGFPVGVSLTQQDPGIVGRPSDSKTLETLDYIETARVTVADSFDAYWATRGKNLRHNVKRQRAKLAEQGTPLRLETIEIPDHVAGAIADYGRLESSGWKAQQGTAVDSNNAQGRFYRNVFETFCRQRSGRIYRYLFGDQVVAMDLCLESPGALVVLKTTYDETMKVVSPATLMRHEIFKSIFDEGRVKRVEFYGKAMEWHLRWTSDLRTLYHVNRYRWGMLKRIRGTLRDARVVRTSDTASDRAEAAGI